MEGRVYVYWNLHKNLYSVRQRGLVRLHAEHVQLRDVTFVVSEAGRQRVLREKRKNVHAGLRGEWAGLPETGWETRGWRKLAYDPYRFDCFVTATGHRPVEGAEQVMGCIVDGRARVYARGLKYRHGAAEAA